MSSRNFSRPPHAAPQPSRWGELGDDHEREPNADQPDAHGHRSLTFGFADELRSGSLVVDLRDEEAVGSNPATPTQERPGQRPFAVPRAGPHVRGHEKVPTGGQVEVPAGGHLVVPGVS
jgi:hypothetical protein